MRARFSAWKHRLLDELLYLADRSRKTRLRLVRAIRDFGF